MTLIKKRHIHLKENTDPSIVNTWINKDPVKGKVTLLDGPDNKGQIIIEYDLEKINWRTIEETLIKNSLLDNASLKSRFVSTVHNFTETNELDNLHAQPMPCCSDPKGIHPKNV